MGLIVLGVMVLIGLALFSVNKFRTGGNLVTENDLGGINSYDAYYGKDAHTYGSKKPCEVCEPKGCIGAGNCRCACHKAEREA